MFWYFLQIKMFLRHTPSFQKISLGPCFATENYAILIWDNKKIMFKNFKDFLPYGKKISRQNLFCQ